MCMSCGCMLPDDDHGESLNILRSDVQAAADAENITLIEVAVNIQRTAMAMERGEA